MSNIYDRRRHHQFLHHKTTIFLPMFCSLSLKDINLTRRRRDSSISDEPTSPKVSCMGQVKRSNRVINLPAAADTAAATHGHHKYSKLKKLFSGKGLSFFPPATSSLQTATMACAAAAAAVSGGRSGSKSCRSSKEVCVDDLRRLKLKKDCTRTHEQGYAKVVDVGELDPPLPVQKRVAQPPGVGRDEVNLWKRRFDGAALKTLQIEHLAKNNKSQLPTV